MKKLKEIVVSGSLAEFPFQLLHKDYGRAEFVICPVFKNGKLVELFCEPQQQETDFYYHIKDINYETFSVQSWEYKGYDVPKIWIHGWCDTHKTQFMRVYPPNDTDMIQFDMMAFSSMDIRFVNHKDSFKQKG